MEIGEKIKQIRSEREMSLDDLSREAGVDWADLHRIESGKDSSPGLDVLRKIADGLAVTVGALFGEETEAKVVLLSARGDEPEAFLAIIRKQARNLTFDERVFLEQTLRSLKDERSARQAQFYDFWKETLEEYRGSARQELLRLVLGIHPDFDSESLKFVPQICEVAKIMLGGPLGADQEDTGESGKR